MFRWIMSVVVSTLLISQVSAQSITGRVVEVIAPNKVNVRLADYSYMTVTLVGPDFGALGQQLCTASEEAKARCSELAKRVKRTSVGVVVEGVDNGDILADLVINGQLVSEHLIAEGVYKLDESYSRSLHLVRAQEKARCAYKGLWHTSYGDARVAKYCQQR